jgi:hypothetical protein
MTRRQLGIIATVLTALFLDPGSASAGVVNPDISVIGQPFTRWTTDPADPARDRLTLDPGEVEFVFDAALNPYAHGTFIGSLGTDGLGLEEGYFKLQRGLPLGLALKGGKYRVGFGRLNPQHPHAYPFAERPRPLAAYLPGGESFDETGVSLSEMFALPGDASLTASADWLQGDTFRIAREPSGAANDPLATAGPGGDGDRADEPRPAWNGRLAGFVPVGDRSGVEIGLSAAGGTNNVAAATRTAVLGVDVKAKLWRSASSYLVVQGELLQQHLEQAGWDGAAAAYTSGTVRPSGGYLFADYAFDTRHDAGVMFERWQRPGGPWDMAFDAFVGLSLMEETTMFRLDWEHWLPGDTPSAPSSPAVDTITLRVIFSMGPHKAHQF